MLSSLNGMRGCWSEHARSAPCLASDKRARPSAPAQHFTHACQVLSAPTQHCTRACRASAQSTRSELRAHLQSDLPTDKHARSSARLAEIHAITYCAHAFPHGKQKCPLKRTCWQRTQISQSDARTQRTHAYQSDMRTRK